MSKRVCSPQAYGLQFYLEQVNQDFLDLIFKNFFFRSGWGTKYYISEKFLRWFNTHNQVITFWELLPLSNIFPAQSLLSPSVFLRFLSLFIHVSKHLELELQTVVRHHAGAGNLTRSSTKAVLTVKLSLQTIFIL